MSAIVIVDTSVLLNILKVPGRDQNWADVMEELGQRIAEDDHLFIPMAAIVEVGNHIAQIPANKGDQRRAAAQRFVDEVKKALSNEAPWKPINFPTNAEVLEWLGSFVDSATMGTGMGDLSIKKEWEALCKRHPMTRVRVWTLDNDLAGLDANP